MVYATFMILVLYLRRADARGDRTLFAAALAAFVAIQAAYLAYGGAFVRYWDVTEYREFFIPVGLLVLAVQVLRRASAATAPCAAGRAAGRAAATR